MKLPQRLPLDQMSINWAQAIEPVLNNPANNSLLLKSLNLVAGTNIISHRLGRKLIGWKPTRIRSVAATFYDLQDSNPTPDLTLILVSDANVTIDLEVL